MKVVATSERAGCVHAGERQLLPPVYTTTTLNVTTGVSYLCISPAGPDVLCRCSHSPGVISPGCQIEPMGINILYSGDDRSVHHRHRRHRATKRQLVFYSDLESMAGRECVQYGYHSHSAAARCIYTADAAERRQLEDDLYIYIFPAELKCSFSSLISIAWHPSVEGEQITLSMLVATKESEEVRYEQCESRWIVRNMIPGAQRFVTVLHSRAGVVRRW